MLSASPGWQDQPKASLTSLVSPEPARGQVNPLSWMSRFPNYHVHSCSFCHNHSLLHYLLLVLLLPLSPRPSKYTPDPTSDPTLSLKPNPVLNPMLSPK